MSETPRILIVDDSPENRYVVRRSLERAGMEVLEAETGADGEARAAEDPDLIVLDVNLPDTTGFEVCRRLKADPRTAHVPVIHLSQSSVDPGARVRGLEGGADAYLTEPIHGSVLVATVRALLRVRQAEDEARRAAADADRQAALNIRLARARTEDEVIRALLELTHSRFPIAHAWRFPARPWSHRPDHVFGPDGEAAGAAVRGSSADGAVRSLPLEELDRRIDAVLDRDRFAEEPRIDYSEPDGRGLAVLPLVAYGRELATLVIEFADGITLPERYRRRIAVSGERSAQAIDRIRLFEAQRAIAIELQASLLPAALPDIPGLSLGADYRPGAQEMVVGGDFYDVFASAGGFVAIIGDVCGRGPAAAARTSLVRHTARVAARYDDDPVAVLDAIQTAMDADRREDQLDLITAACVRIRPYPRGGAELDLAIAGHPLPLLVRADGTVEPVGIPGPMLGLHAPGASPTVVDVSLAPGDGVLLYTDGVTESRSNGELFGEERLMELLGAERAAGAGAFGLASAPLLAAAAFNEAHDDDMATLMLLARPLS